MPTPSTADPLLRRLSAPSVLNAAFLRVQGNGGCPGADAVTVETFGKRLSEELARLSLALREGRYRPFPLARLAIPKPNGGERYLAIPTVRDRVAQAAAYIATRRRFEKEFEDASFAYRPGRSVRQALERVRTHRDAGFQWVVDADIEAFFDNIPHDLLLQRLEEVPLGTEVRRLLARWITVEIYDGTRVWPLEKGVPQGSVVSPMMANLYLDHLDEQLAAHGLRLVRYGDDFLVLCRDRASAEEALQVTDAVLEKLRLRLNKEKTRVTNFSEGFRFLGATFLRRGIYLRLEPRAARSGTLRPPPPLDLLRYLELRGAPPA